MSGIRTNNNTGRYSRNLQGWNAQGFFTPLEVPTYTVLASPQQFLAGALEGELGVYLEDGTLVVGAPPTAPFQIYQKQDGNVKVSTKIKPGTYDTIDSSYQTAQKNEWVVGANTGTGGSGLNISIVGGLQEFVVQVRDTTPGNQPFPVSEGRSIVRSGTPTDYEIVRDIVNDLNNSFDYEGNGDERTFSADVSVANAALGTAAAVVATYNFYQDSNTVITDVDVSAEILQGSYLVVGITNPQLIFRIVKVAADGLSFQIDGPWSRETVSTAETSISIATQVDLDARVADLGIDIVGLSEVTHLNVIATEDLADATVSENNPWRLGSGEPWQVAAMEDECAVFQGWTTINAAWLRDFGQPTLFVDDRDTDPANGYAQKFLKIENSIIPSAGTPQNQTLMLANIVIATINGAQVHTQIDLIFP